MDFIANQNPQRQQMLHEIGITSVDELFGTIPEDLRLPPPTQDDGLSEYEGMRLIEKLSEGNTFHHYDNYLGAGAYEHHIPALVEAICSRSEFLTAYTPYQAEASQGILQTIFEFQSALCALTGMAVTNASLYDGASACAEAVLMALRYHKNRKKVILANTVHPHYWQVIKQYLSQQGIQLIKAPSHAGGALDTARAQELIDRDTAAIVLQSPNFFGIVEKIQPITSVAADKGALTVLCGNPLSYGLFACPAELGADIAVGDCQPFGLPLNYGGPYIGYLACKESLLRQIPGRVVGETVDTTGKRGFVLTLQAREQHIRREKATSNICTNQALAALACLVTILWYGKEGIKKLALTNTQRAHYLKDNLTALPTLSCPSTGPHFNEFVITLPMPAKQAQQLFRKHGIEPGVDLTPYFPSSKNRLLIAVTETKSKQQLDHYLDVARQIS